ncbi:hypothetical protein SLEP1_g54023 [Rubroshorea leprosula]|uniref:Uncharacterized protein n=1 Tax=Rubroshorea leprosula TaxID=152421 RepID=A0AAV5ME12_9ROSI|nr:hypothetical protein SLEP1_g54023 [Rubroshorea leprosula]
MNLLCSAATHESFCSAAARYAGWGKICLSSKIPIGIPVPVNRRNGDGEGVPGLAGPVAISNN